MGNLKYRMVAIDLDDTLLRDDLTISEPTKEAIKEAASLGVKVTFATGRMYQSALPYAKDLGINVPIITYQGAYVKDTKGEVLLAKTIAPDLAKEIILKGREYRSHVQVYIDDQLYAEKENEYVKKYSKISNVKFNIVNDLLALTNKEMLKILYIDESAKLDRIWQELRQFFGEKVNITKSKEFFLEFTHPQGTKGQAVKYLADRLEIPLEKVIAIGDNLNDLDMIEVAGLGVAMGNGHPKLKEKADYITSQNNDDGVLEVLKRFIL